MEEIVVKGEDLIGDLEGFPKEVVIKMVHNQVLQGNEEDVKIFQNDKFADKDSRGFDWEESPEGVDFWIDLISIGEFHLFFEKFPKESFEIPIVKEDEELIKAVELLKGLGYKIYKEV